MVYASWTLSGICFKDLGEKTLGQQGCLQGGLSCQWNGIQLGCPWQVAAVVCPLLSEFVWPFTVTLW
jgi:hypothetical protein